MPDQFDKAHDKLPIEEQDSAAPADKGQAGEDGPRIGQIAELREQAPEIDESQPLELSPVTRRDLLKAAAALGIGAGAATETGVAAERRGSISYVVCNRAMNVPIKKVEFSPGHSRLAALGQDGQIVLWDPKHLGAPVDFTAGKAGGKPAGKLKSSPGADFDWGRNERLLVIGNGKLRCYDTAGNKLLFDVSAPNLKTAAFTPDGKQVVALFNNYRVQLYDSASGKQAYSLDLAGKIQSLPAESRVSIGDVSFVGMTREDPSRIYIASKKSAMLVKIDQPEVASFHNPANSFDELVISKNSEMVGYLRKGDKTLDVFAFPSGLPWRAGLRLTALNPVWALSPTLECFITASKDKLQVQNLNAKAEGKSQYESDADLNAVTCLSCAWDPGVFAWGGDDGRIVVGKEGTPAAAPGASPASRPAPAPAGQLGGAGPASAAGDSLTKTAAIDATISKIREYKPSEAKLPYSDCACTCNSVTVTASHNERISQVWDSAHAKWISSTQPCGSPIPAGAVCVCNCVKATASPIWTTICTCNTVCTCNTQSRGYTLSYWY